MSGEWLVLIGRAIVSRETFERLIAPSIADLQVESHHGLLLRWRHYLGILNVMIHALCQDLRRDISFTCWSETSRPAWKSAAIWYAGFVILLTYLGLRYNLPQGLPLRGLWGPALAITGLEAVITSVLPGMTAAAVYLTRKSCSRRSILLVTLTVAALMTLFALTVEPARVWGIKALAYAMSSTPGAGVAQFYSYRLDKDVAWWRDIQIGIQVIPSALLGMLLARRKGWSVVLGVAAYFASWLLIVILLTTTFHSGPAPSPVMQGWREIALNFAALLVLYLLDRRRSDGPSVSDA
jgi:hypothetical protein